MSLQQLGQFVGGLEQIGFAQAQVFQGYRDSQLQLLECLLYELVGVGYRLG